MNQIVAEQLKFKVVRHEKERGIGKIIAVFESYEVANDYVKYMQSFNNPKYDYFMW